MSDTHSPDFENDGVVMHDDLRELLTDARASHCAVTALVSLLRCGPIGTRDDLLDAADRNGLAVLLESVENRLALVVDGFVVMAVALGLEEARELGLAAPVT